MSVFNGLGADAYEGQFGGASERRFRPVEHGNSGKVGERLTRHSKPTAEVIQNAMANFAQVLDKLRKASRQLRPSAVRVRPLSDPDQRADQLLLSVLLRRPGPVGRNHGATPNGLIAELQR